MLSVVTMGKLSPLFAILNTFFDLCLLRLAPQDLPFSTFLLGAVLVLDLLFSWVLGAIANAPAQAWLQAVVGILVMVIFTCGVLRLKQYGPRCLQTLTALSGVNLLLTLIALPLAGWSAQVEPNQEAALLTALLWFALIIWSLVITAHIFKHALSTNTTVSMMVTLLYFFIAQFAIGIVH